MELLILLAKIIGLTFLVVLPLVPISVYFERRFSAVIQDRVGPNRVGIPLTLFGAKKDFSFAGLIQPMADGVKLFLKEDFTPSYVRKAFYWLAPALTVAPSLITLAVIPFGSTLTIGGYSINLAIADIDVGPLFIFSIASLSVYGITLAGWSSNSKYPFIGGVRSTLNQTSTAPQRRAALRPARAKGKSRSTKGSDPKKIQWRSMKTAWKMYQSALPTR